MSDDLVARPVHAVERPASMAMLVKTARALRVLHGHGVQWLEYADRIVYFTAGTVCDCDVCAEHLRAFIGTPHTPHVFEWPRYAR